MNDPKCNDTAAMSGVDSSDLFDPSKLAERYVNVVSIDRGWPWKWSYRVEEAGTGNELGDINFNDDGECAYCLDNYPAPRRFWRSNLPMRNWGDFESDMKRMGFILSNAQGEARTHEQPKENDHE